MIKAAFLVSREKMDVLTTWCYNHQVFFLPNPLLCGSFLVVRPAVPQSLLNHRCCQGQEVCVSLSPSPQPTVNPRLNQARITVVHFNFQALTGESRPHPTPWGWHQGQGATQAAVWVMGESAPHSLTATSTPSLQALSKPNHFQSCHSAPEGSVPFRTQWLTTGVLQRKVTA